MKISGKASAAKYGNRKLEIKSVNIERIKKTIFAFSAAGGCHAPNKREQHCESIAVPAQDYCTPRSIQQGQSFRLS